MSAGVLRFVVASATTALLGSACVVLDLFPDGEQGGGGSGASPPAGAGGGPTSTTGTDSVTSTGAGGGAPAPTVEWVTGLSSAQLLASVVFLDVAADASAVAVVGRARGTPTASVSFAGCSAPLPFDGAFFVARFSPDKAECAGIVFFDISPTEPVTASVVLQSGESRVAVSGDLDGQGVTAVYGVLGNGSPYIILDEQLGIAITDLADDNGTLWAGGSVSVATPACGGAPDVGAGDKDAFYAQIIGSNCSFPQIGHTEMPVGHEAVSSVAVSSGRRGLVTASEHSLSVYGQTFDGGSSVAIFQDEMGPAFALGDFTCAQTLAPPRAAFSVNGDWIFGPVCGRLEVAFRLPSTAFEELLDVNPTPTFFDRPSIAVAGDRLLFGGEYSSDGAQPFWPSQLRTGVVGAVNTQGTPVFTLDLSSNPLADGATEITGVVASADGNTAWVIGNFATSAVTLGTAQHRGVGLTCSSSSTPCMPLLAKLDLSPR